MSDGLLNPLAPKVGRRISSSQFKNEILDPIRTNDEVLLDRIKILEAQVAGLPVTYRQSTVPDVGKEKDSWYHTGEENQLYVCSQTYSTSSVNKIDFWDKSHDLETKSATTANTQTINTSVQTIISDDPPNAAFQGWIWVESDNSNRTFVCNETYAATDGPDSFPTIEAFRESKFIATTNYNAQLLAAAEQGLKDGKTNQVLSPSVPDSMDARDTWIDSDADNAIFICVASYKATDGLPWDNVTNYEIGDIVTYNTNLYTALVVNVNVQPPGGSGEWSLLGAAYANITLFRESRFVPGSDPVARQLAEAAEGIADGKTFTHFGTDFPAAADSRDLFYNTGTNQAYLCPIGYDESFTGDRSTKWVTIDDPVSRQKAEDALALHDNRIDTFVQSDMPSEADIRDMWVDTDDNYQIYTCIASYTTGTGTIENNWRKSSDTAKTNTTTSPTIPERCGLGDLWVKSDENNKLYVCIQAYESNGTIAVNWQSVSDNKKTIFYQAGPPVDASIGDGWLDTETTKGDFQFYVASASYSAGGHGYIDESNTGVWRPSKDKNAESIASNAAQVAAGKSTSFYSNDLPDVAERGDIWVDTDDFFPGTSLNRTYVATVSYSSGQGIQPGTPGSQWTEYADPVAQRTAFLAGALADRKRKIVYLDNVPDASLQVNEDGVIDGFDVGDGWYETDTGQFYICNTAHTSGAIQVNWSPSIDVAATQAAIDAKAAVDFKRTTFYTAFVSSDTTSFPGPTTILEWNALTTTNGTVGAQIGDIWVNIAQDNQEVTKYVCVVAYTGFGGEIGTKAGNWKSFTEDKILQDQFADHLDLAGTKAMKGTITHVASQQFNGHSVDVSNGGHFGDVITVDQPASSNNHLTRLGEVNTLIQNAKNEILNGAGPAFDTLLELQQALGNDPNFATTITTLVNNAQSTANGKVSKTGDTMTGNLIHEGGDRRVIIGNVQISIVDPGGNSEGNLEILSGNTLMARFRRRAGSDYAAIESNNATYALSLGNKRLGEIGNGFNPNDAVTKQQLDAISGSGVAVASGMTRGFNSTLDVTLNETNIGISSKQQHFNVFCSHGGIWASIYYVTNAGQSFTGGNGQYALHGPTIGDISASFSSGFGTLSIPGFSLRIEFTYLNNNSIRVRWQETNGAQHYQDIRVIGFIE